MFNHVYFGAIMLLVATSSVKQTDLKPGETFRDDIGSTLSSISIMAELAKVQSAEAPTLLASIGESTTSIQENMGDIVWAIKSENDRFENVLRRLNACASGILEARGIWLDFVDDEALSTSRLSMGQRKNL